VILDHDHQLRGAADLAKGRGLWLYPPEKREEGDDTDAINKMFAPEFRQTGLDSIITYQTISRPRSSPRWWRSFVLPARGRSWPDRERHHRAVG